MPTRKPSSPDYTIAPDVLVWARETAMLNREDAARALGVSIDRLEQWERGEQRPGLTHLRAMAARYRRPLATLFLPQPPGESPLPVDFRTRTVAGKRAPFTPELAFAIREAMDWQERASDLVAEDPSLYPQPDIPQFTLETDVEEAATALRAQLSLTAADQLSWRDPATAWRHLRARVQRHGVLVFVQKIPRDVCRAFSLWNGQRLPVIVVTSADAPVAHNFSLFHEYAHLALRQDALCLFDESDGDTDRARTEHFCNRFAAAVLMSVEVLERALDQPLAEFRGQDWSLEELTPLARRLKVSRAALALRLEQLGLARHGLYADVTAELAGADERVPPPAHDQRGGSFLVARLNERGLAYSRIAVAAWRKGLATAAEVAEMLNIPARRLPAYEEHINAQLERYGG